MGCNIGISYGDTGCPILCVCLPKLLPVPAWPSTLLFPHGRSHGNRPKNPYYVPRVPRAVIRNPPCRRKQAILSEKGGTSGRLHRIRWGSLLRFPIQAVPRHHPREKVHRALKRGVRLAGKQHIQGHVVGIWVIPSGYGMLDRETGYPVGVLVMFPPSLSPPLRGAMRLAPSGDPLETGVEATRFFMRYPTGGHMLQQRCTDFAFGGPRLKELNAPIKRKTDVEKTEGRCKPYERSHDPWYDRGAPVFFFLLSLFLDFGGQDLSHKTDLDKKQNYCCTG